MRLLSFFFYLLKHKTVDPRTKKWNKKNYP